MKLGGATDFVPGEVLKSADLNDTYNAAQTWQVDFDANTKKLTNLGAPTSANDATRKTDVFARIADTTLGSDLASVSLTWTGTYRIFHLYAYCKPTSGTGQDLRLRFNGDTGNNYFSNYLQHGGTSVSNNNATYGFYVLGRGYSPYLSSAEATVICIAAGQEKLITSRGSCNIGGEWEYIVNGKWNNTASEITSFDLSFSIGNIAAGSRFILFATT